jgi:thioredoxin 1
VKGLEGLTRRGFIIGPPPFHYDESLSKVVTLTDDNFEEEVLNAQHPVLVDAWAKWCSSCPTVHKYMVDWSIVYNEDKPRLKICEAEQREAPHVTGLLTSNTFPAFGLFYKGNLEYRQTGDELDRLKRNVDSFLVKWGYDIPPDDAWKDPEEPDGGI